MHSDVIKPPTTGEESAFRQELARLYTQHRLDAALETTGISESTVRRWISGESRPRRANLKTLLRQLPDEERQILWPHATALWPDLETDEPSSEPVMEPITAIPSPFYSRVLKALRESPPSLRYRSICQLVLHQALLHFDPARDGMQGTVVHCIFDEKQHLVQYLYERFTLGWNPIPANQRFLQGAESIAGETVSSASVVITPTSIAVPILRAGHIGGALRFSAPKPLPSFNAEMAALMWDYADLVALALDLQDFYDVAQIKLLVMPPPDRQEPLLATLQARKITFIREQRISAAQAEQCALQQIADELVM